MSEDIRDGIEGSSGNPIVLLVLNVALSVAFAYMVIYASDLANITAFDWQKVGALALILIAITHFVTSE